MSGHCGSGHDCDDGCQCMPCQLRAEREAHAATQANYEQAEMQIMTSKCKDCGSKDLRHDWERCADRLVSQLAVERKAHAATQTKLVDAQRDKREVEVWRDRYGLSLLEYDKRFADIEESLRLECERTDALIYTIEKAADFGEGTRVADAIEAIKRARAEEKKRWLVLTHC